MTEAKVKSLVRKQLEKDGYMVWYPAISRFAPKFPYSKESAKDIFTLFDCLAWQDSEIRFIQYTTFKNRRAREKKIKDFYEKNKCFLPAEVWSIREDNSIDIIYI